MSEVVNLRQARKRAARKVKEAEAEANRVAFGLPSELKAKARRESDRAGATLDAHRIDRSGSSNESGGAD